MKIRNGIYLLTLVCNITLAESDHQMHAPISDTDNRKPVFLTEMMAEHQKANMRGHLEAIQEILGAFAEKNFAKMADSGKKLGTSAEMTNMCQHMGQATPGFTEVALKMHSEADKITEAALKKNLNGVLAATHRTLQACTACHSAFKQQIVNEVDWKKLIENKTRSSSTGESGHQHN
jgi:cytochrome c556